MIDYEAKVQKLYEHVLRPGDRCVDVGANVGRHLFPMMECVSPGGHVYAFEPIPYMNANLQGEISRRRAGGAITLHPYALSDADGESEFVVAVDSPGYSGLKERTYDIPTRLERIQVQIRMLDGVLAGVDGVRFIKIDVEGGEWGVIRGATRLIERNRPVVGFEFGMNSYEKYGVDPGAVYDFFATRDYVLFDILGGRMDGRQHFVDSSRLQKVWDYAAVPSQSAAEAAGYFA